MRRPGWQRGRARHGAAAAAALAFALAGSRLQAAPPDVAADKAVPVRLSPVRFYVPRAGAPPPADWTERAFDDGGWGGPAAGLVAPRSPVPLPGVPASGGTLYDPVPGAPLLMRARFDVPASAHVRVLELRVAYGDAFVAWINGHEVARRGLGVGTPTQVRVPYPHGSEVEHVYLPVPSAAIPELAPTGNVLAVLVRAFAGASPLVPVAPTAALDLAASSGVRIVRGPYLMAPAESREGASVEVAWETDLPASGVVTVEDATVEGRDAPPGRRVAAAALATRQVVTLRGLGRGRRYRYRVEVEARPGDAATSGPHLFETLPPAPRPLRFAVYGDMRSHGHEAHRAVVAGLVREAPALVFNTGDLTDIGSEESNWQRYFEITAPLGAIAPVVPALGNHDAARSGIGARRSWGLFGLRSAAPPGTQPGWTSLDLGGVHFIVLDTNGMNNRAQQAWLADDLTRARQRHPRAIFAFCHEGPWSHGLHGSSATMVDQYAPLLAAAKVDVLFCGHDHMYERGTEVTPSGKLVYVVTGGGGAPLYDPSCRARTGPPPGDVPAGLPLCPPSVAALVKAYHYIMVEVGTEAITVCPKRPDGSPLEPCFKLPRAR